MQKAAAERTSPSRFYPPYLSALYTQPEWAAAFANDPTGQDRKLIPVRVQDCKIDGLWKAIVYIDLVDQLEKEAAHLLLTGMSDHRGKPSERPIFPIHPNEAPAAVPTEGAVAATAGVSRDV